MNLLNKLLMLVDDRSAEADVAGRLLQHAAKLLNLL
jgi:hypothetical protein